MKRKIVQITANEKFLYALCEDGSVHTMPVCNGAGWVEMPQVKGDTRPSEVPVKEGELSPAFLKGQRDAKTYGSNYKCPYHHTNTLICSEWWDGFKTVYPNVHFRL